MKIKILITTLLIGLSFGVVLAQNFNKLKLDSLMDILAEKNQAMGSLVISKNGVVVYSRAIGYSDISGNEKLTATNQTKYRIGSITKIFTATMIFQLIEDGKLSLRILPSVVAHSRTRKNDVNFVHLIYECKEQT